MKLLYQSTLIYYSPFDDGIEIRRAFLDLSKAFDEGWHEVLLYKLEQNGISGDVLKVVADFFYRREQRAVLSSIHSSRANAEAGLL